MAAIKALARLFGKAASKNKGARSVLKKVFGTGTKGSKKIKGKDTIPDVPMRNITNSVKRTTIKPKQIASGTAKKAAPKKAGGIKKAAKVGAAVAATGAAVVGTKKAVDKQNKRAATRPKTSSTPKKKPTPKTSSTPKKKPQERKTLLKSSKRLSTASVKKAEPKQGPAIKRSKVKSSDISSLSEKSKTQAKGVKEKGIRQSEKPGRRSIARIGTTFFGGRD